MFTKEEARLFSMIAGSLDKENYSIEDQGEADLHSIIELAGHHAVLPIIYPSLKEASLVETDRAFLEATVRGTAAQFYQLLFIARDTIRILAKGGVPTVLLKGASAARFYPIPESRKSSDIDLLLADPEDAGRAAALLEAAGYHNLDKKDVNHHQSWGTPDNHLLELHVMLVEPFDRASLNRYIQNRYRLNDSEIGQAQVLGISVPVFGDDRMAFHLLLHMLQDFLRSGFGLKLLCDWVAFWNRKVDASSVEHLLADVRACRLEGFLAAVTSVCARYLGLRTDGSGTFHREGTRICYEEGVFCDTLSDSLADEFMLEIVDAERYGKPEADRMVALHGTGPLSYVREFHHQTVLSFPKAGRIPLLLPVLYVIVLARFLRNNRTVRRQSAASILRKAGQRSRLARKLL